MSTHLHMHTHMRAHAHTHTCTHLDNNRYKRFKKRLWELSRCALLEAATEKEQRFCFDRRILAVHSLQTLLLDITNGRLRGTREVQCNTNTVVRHNSSVVNMTIDICIWTLANMCSKVQLWHFSV